MQKTLSTSLWINGKEKANEYSGSHSPTQRIYASNRTFVEFFVTGMMSKFSHENYQYNFFHIYFVTVSNYY